MIFSLMLHQFRQGNVAVGIGVKGLRGGVQVVPDNSFAKIFARFLTSKERMIIGAHCQKYARRMKRARNKVESQACGSLVANKIKSQSFTQKTC